MKQHLNDATIKNTKPTAKTQTFKDGGGLFLYIEPNGSKRWRWRYIFEGKPCLLSLGVYPDVTLKKARDERDRLKELLLEGVNPSAQRKAQKSTPDGHEFDSFEQVAREWHLEFTPDKTAGTNERILRQLKKDVFPYIGKMNIARITPQDVLAVLRRTKERGTLETAHRLRGICGQVFRYGVQTGKCAHDVCHELRGSLPQPIKQHRAAFTEPADVRRLLQSFDRYNGSYPVLCALKLSVLWFVRPSELRLARWADFDFDGREWRYTVTKTNTPHIVPLCTQAIDILNDLHPLTGAGEYVFSIQSGKPMSEATVNKAIRRLGFDTQTEFTGHGVRAMARTMLAEKLKFPPEIIEHQLAHKVPDALGRAYNRTKYIDDRHRMMQVWANYLDELKAGAQVVKFRA